MAPEYATETVTAELIPGVNTVVAQKGQLVDPIFRPHVPDSAVTTTEPAPTPVDYGPVHEHNREHAQLANDHAKAEAERLEAERLAAEAAEAERLEAERIAGEGDGQTGEKAKAPAKPAAKTRPAKARPAAANKARSAAKTKAASK